MVGRSASLMAKCRLLLVKLIATQAAAAKAKLCFLVLECMFLPVLPYLGMIVSAISKMLRSIGLHLCTLKYQHYCPIYMDHQQSPKEN